MKPFDNDPAIEIKPLSVPNTATFRQFLDEALKRISKALEVPEELTRVGL